MQQLITIETIPISIKYVGKAPELIADERVATSQKPAASSTMEESPPASAKTDSFVRANPADIYNLTYTATATYLENGNLRLNVQMNDDETSAFVFQQFGRDIQAMIRRIFQDKQSSSFEFQSMQLNFDLSQIQNATPGSGNTGRIFTPPDFELEILERPKVVIKYVGGPLYIPRSADPNYEAPEKIDKLI